MSEEKSILGELYDYLFARPIPMWIGSIILAMISMGMLVMAQPWGASCAILNWGQNIYGIQYFGSTGAAVPDTLFYKCAMSMITLLLGAMAAAFFARKWALRIAPPWGTWKRCSGWLIYGFWLHFR